MTTKNYNMRAMKEMEVISRTCNTPEAFIPAMERLVEKYQASERIVKTFDNGLERVEILDKDGLIVGEYTRGPVAK